MLNADRFTTFAEAIADGTLPEWPPGPSLTPEESEQLGNLRALASIGHLFASISGTARSARIGAPVAPLAAGAQWGTLRIIEAVGRGRYGQVYRAWDPALAREVALKLVARRDGDEAVETQVVEEGRLMARVRHPNVVTIHGAQRIDGISGLWMEFINGRTLAAELEERGPFAADSLMLVGMQLCHALEAVHQAGLVHRDVKAHNVMREASGRVVLGDFGTGREVVDDRGVAGLAGTPAYLAPEIFDRQAATPRSDIYSLGTLLFHLATRRYPVEGRSLRALRDAHASGERTSLRMLRPELPHGLCDVVDTALCVDAAKRFPSAASMADALTHCQPQKKVVWRRRAFAFANVAMVTALTIVSAIVWRANVSPSAQPQGVTSSSPRAFELYQHALALQDYDGNFAGNAKTAEQLLRQAVKEDPNFVGAYSLLSGIVWADGNRSGQSRIGEAVAIAERAVSLAEFAGPIERIRQ